MRALDRGESFLVTRNGVPVGELIPFRQRRFVSAAAAVSAFALPVRKIIYRILRRPKELSGGQRCRRPPAGTQPRSSNQVI